jgi:hypothetical protein
MPGRHDNSVPVKQFSSLFFSILGIREVNLFQTCRFYLILLLDGSFTPVLSLLAKLLPKSVMLQRHATRLEVGGPEDIEALNQMQRRQYQPNIRVSGAQPPFSYEDSPVAGGTPPHVRMGAPQSRVGGTATPPSAW